MPKGNTALAAFKAGLKSKRTGKSHKRKLTLSLAIIAGMAPTAAFVYQGMQEGGIDEAVYRLTGRMTGYNTKVDKWLWQEVAKCYGPVIVGAVLHKLANRLGVNRMIASAGIPLLRV